MALSKDGWNRSELNVAEENSKQKVIRLVTEEDDQNLTEEEVLYLQKLEKDLDKLRSINTRIKKK